MRAGINLKFTYHFLLMSNDYLPSKKFDIIGKIKLHVKDNKDITYDKLIVKIKVNPPYLSVEKAKEYISDLITDGQITIDKSGVLQCPR